MITEIRTIPTQPVFPHYAHEDAVRRIIEHGFAVIERPGLNFMIKESDLAWRAFCAQPTSQKQRSIVALENDDPSEGPDNGYVPKGQYLPFDTPAQRAKQEQDNKQFWHYRPLVPRILRARKYHGETEERLCNATAILYRALEIDLIKFGAALDHVFPGFAIADGLKAKQHPDPFGHVLRLLLYKDVEAPGEELARGHTDRDAITLHVADSRPGLVVYLRDGKQFQVPTLPDTLIAFFGKRMSVRTNGALRALNHRVISPSELGVPADRRTCTVFFSQVPDDHTKFDPKWMFT